MPGRIGGAKGLAEQRGRGDAPSSVVARSGRRAHLLPQPLFFRSPLASAEAQQRSASPAPMRHSAPAPPLS